MQEGQKELYDIRSVTLAIDGKRVSGLPYSLVTLIHLALPSIIISQTSSSFGFSPRKLLTPGGTTLFRESEPSLIFVNVVFSGTIMLSGVGLIILSMNRLRIDYLTIAHMSGLVEFISTNSLSIVYAKNNRSDEKRNRASRKKELRRAMRTIQPRKSDLHVQGERFRMMAQQLATQCPDCKSTNMKQTFLKHEDGKSEQIAICQNCDRYIFPNVEYIYLVRGLAKNWSSHEDLQATIEDISRTYMPPTDVQELKVEVAELA